MLVLALLISIRTLFPVTATGGPIHVLPAAKYTLTVSSGSPIVPPDAVIDYHIGLNLLFNTCLIRQIHSGEKRYEYDLITEKDRINQLAFSRKEGGTEERKEALETIANKLFDKGFSPGGIAEIISTEGD